MTKPPFHGKYQIAPPAKTIFSLSFRVILVCFFFVVLPLGFYVEVIRKEMQIEQTAESQKIALQSRHDQFLHSLARVLFITFLCGTIAAILLIYLMARPFKYFTALMQKVGTGDLRVRYHRKSLGFEINTLGKQFNHMLEAWAQTTEEKKKLKEEIAICRSIQRFIFPQQLPRLPQFDIGVSFTPASEVTGDFYDLFVHKTSLGERLLIVMGDASGKGLGACLYAFLLRSMLRSFALSGSTLQQIIEQTNQLFCLDTNEDGMFVTAWVGILDIASNRLDYASLGHCPALLKKSSGEVVELTTKESAFGLPFKKPVKIDTTFLEQNQHLFLYTDGWIETFNHRKLTLWLSKLPMTLTSTEILTSLDNVVLEKVELQDDRTALVLRLTPNHLINT